MGSILEDAPSKWELRARAVAPICAGAGLDHGFPHPFDKLRTRGILRWVLQPSLWPRQGRLLMSHVAGSEVPGPNSPGLQKGN